MTTDPTPDRLEDLRAEYAQTGMVTSDGAVWLVSQVVVLREQVQRLSASAAVSVPPPAPRADDRAAALAEAIAAIEAERDATDVNVAVYPRYDGKERMALGSAIRVLRRLADEAAVSGPCVAGEQQNETPEAEAGGCTCGVAGDCFVPSGHYADCPSAAAPAVVAQPGKETDTGARVVAHVLATHTDLHCLNCAPTPLGDVWTPVTADELDDGGVCAQCGVDVLAGPRR